jgi:hypothetical protein
MRVGRNSTTTVLLGLAAVVVVAFFVVMNSPGQFGGDPSPASTSGGPVFSLNIHERLDQCEETLGMCQKGQSKPVRIIKQAVVISANENPFYSFFAPLVTWTWINRIGFDCIVIMTRNVSPLIVDAVRWAGGIPVIMDITWPIGSGKMMQNVRTLAAALREGIDENTILMTGDADMFPLNKSYFQLPQNMADLLVVHGNHPATLPVNQYPLCYLSMTVKLWRDIMDLNSVTLNEAMVRMYLSHQTQIRDDIYVDQDYFYRQVQSYKNKHPEFKVKLEPWYNVMRLDFRIWRDYNFDPNTSWLDAPALRPGFTKLNWPRFKEGLLRHLFDADTIAYFDKFRDDFVRVVMNGDDEANGLMDGFGRKS